MNFGHHPSSKKAPPSRSQYRSVHISETVETVAPLEQLALEAVPPVPTDIDYNLVFSDKTPSRQATVEELQQIQLGMFGTLRFSYLYEFLSAQYG